MKGTSPFFARIKGDVLKIVSAIPTGKCSTYKSIGEHLDAVPRHVAYILATLSDTEKSRHPWHRVVADNGMLGEPKVSELGTPQSELLCDEGLLIAHNKVETNHHGWFVSASTVGSGVTKQTRPSNAPSTLSTKTAR